MEPVGKLLAGRGLNAMSKKLAEIPIRFLKGIGPKRERSFQKLGIHSIEDMLYYFPRRYEDRSRFVGISQLKEGEPQTIKGTVLARGEKQSWKRRRFKILEVVAGDETGRISCVWFNQGYLKDYFEIGATVILFGSIERYQGRLQMNSPEFEIVSKDADESLNIGRITPIYFLPERSTQRHFRQVIKACLEEYVPVLCDTLPYDMRARNHLLNLAQSLIHIHFPDDLNTQKQAYERLSFEEFLLFQLPLILRKMKKKEKRGIAHKPQGALVGAFISNLPFKLTTAQEKVIQEIKLDMARPQAMQRLLQGDVGSGKTAVATVASMITIQGGYQVAFMVPTEVLARQHYNRISSQLGVRSSELRQIKVGLLTSSANKKEKEKIYQGIKEGSLDLIIGTHALLEENVQFRNLGLVVIDEQHKFGVGQRALLPKKGANPDCLIMTATPIPRTLAITLYGDLDISIIGELPPGRVPIKTLHVREEDRPKAYKIAREQLDKGRQVYVIYPVIEQSYSLDMAGAKKMFTKLKAGVFKDFNLGLIHGRLKQKEQDEILQKFKDRELDILVSTTVLEVGIDMPHATCMIVEHAERFGLSQLHQLRGRVGRSIFESFCVLVSSAGTPEAKKRIEAMMNFSDGFKIAQQDLKIRGPGEFFGSRQHGLTELRIGNPLTQMQLLKRARLEAIRLLGLDSHLELRQNAALKEKLSQRFPEYEKLMLVG
ncbi:MAG: ATP-dependent DNA helicase RecG [Candidatus Omnitrophota bacterium]